MNKYFKIFMALPKTVYYNIKLFGIKRGIRLPIYVGGIRLKRVKVVYQYLLKQKDL